MRVCPFTKSPQEQHSNPNEKNNYGRSESFCIIYLLYSFEIYVPVLRSIESNKKNRTSETRRWRLLKSLVSPMNRFLNVTSPQRDTWRVLADELLTFDISVFVSFDFPTMKMIVLVHPVTKMAGMNSTSCYIVHYVKISVQHMYSCQA